MIEKILQPKNLTKAYHKVVSNKGSSGVDGMSVYKLSSYRDENGIRLMSSTEALINSGLTSLH